MGAYKYLQALYRKKQSETVRFLQRIKGWEYRQQPSIIRLARPSRVERARRLGYKNKAGFVVYRVRVRRGSRKKPLHKGIPAGKPRNQGIYVTNRRSLQGIAEARVGRKLGALRVLNSYWMNQDAKWKWFEVILVDPTKAQIQQDASINWICANSQKHREARGITRAGRKARGLTSKGFGSRKLRPSARSYWRKSQTRKFRRRRSGNGPSSNASGNSHN